jgi:hypothetical protein
MAEREVQPIDTRVSTRKLIAFVNQVNLRKLPGHATAVYQALAERQRKAAA